MIQCCRYLRRYNHCLGVHIAGYSIWYPPSFGLPGGLSTVQFGLSGTACESETRMTVILLALCLVFFIFPHFSEMVLQTLVPLLSARAVHTQAMLYGRVSRGERVAPCVCVRVCGSVVR